MLIRMAQYARRRLGRMLADESGQDLIEYALLTGIITVAAILVFPAVRVKMTAAYQAWNGQVQAISVADPPPPL